MMVSCAESWQGSSAEVRLMHSCCAGKAAALGGMWGSPQRFNVAITRARALLVAVGHPTVLMKVRDPRGHGYRLCCRCRLCCTIAWSK